MTFISFAARMVATAVLVVGASLAAFGKSSTSVLTFHNNYQRWGWNSTETILTPSAISSSTSKFGVIATVDTLDSTPYAQPLIVPQILIHCPTTKSFVTCETKSNGVHDVVFVATVLNTIYAIDANTGVILLERNLGVEGSCGGIVSTPVIDPVANVLYVMSHSNLNGAQKFKLYALNLTTLVDVVIPYNITRSDTLGVLTNARDYGFDGTQACQRPALLLLNGNIYAGFSGQESGHAPARGWLLAWKASDLTPLTPFLTNQEAASTNKYFLSSIWMSGAGIASDGTNLYFVTGNSDPAGLSYDPVKNVEESVVELTPEMKVSSVFTPYNYATLDLNDADFGSGGVMLLPTTPPLAVAAGKDGRMFLLNGDSLGGYTPGGPDNDLDMHQIGGCYCAPSYYQNAVGLHVVSSGGTSLLTWKLAPGTGGANPTLVQDGEATLPASIEDGGFFTSVSSNGSATPVIWAIGRPTDASGAITLYAYDGAPVSGSLTLLGSYPAGTWTDPRNLTSVPVVANGKVYVLSGTGSTGTLTIFGFPP